VTLEDRPTRTVAPPDGPTSGNAYEAINQSRKIWYYKTSKLWRWQLISFFPEYYVRLKRGCSFPFFDPEMAMWNTTCIFSPPFGDNIGAHYHQADKWKMDHQIRNQIHVYNELVVNPNNMLVVNWIHYKIECVVIIFKKANVPSEIDLEHSFLHSIRFIISPDCRRHIWFLWSFHSTTARLMMIIHLLSIN
jgi:hypothetical protein